MSTKIDWCDETWNPVTGCRHSCAYCYARRMAKRLKGMGQPKYRNGFKPTFHSLELDRPSRWKRPSKVFVCSMADLFGEWIPNEWIDAVLESVQHYNWHTYLFLTKNPQRLIDFSPWPHNAWVGASATDADSASLACAWLRKVQASAKFLSVEPLLGPTLLGRNNLDWVIIGKQTGPGAQPIKARWVIDLTEQAKEQGLAVFHKDSLKDLGLSLKEFPNTDVSKYRSRFDDCMTGIELRIVPERLSDWT